MATPARNAETWRDHVLDAVALNDMESHRLHNPATPEPDSLMEYVEVLALDVDVHVPEVVRERFHRHVNVLRGCANTVFLLNAREGDSERAAVPTLERACRREHRFPVRRLADELRPLLGMHDGVGFVRLVCRVRELLAHEQVGRDVLLSGALAHELGATPSARLVELVGHIEASS